MSAVSGAVEFRTGRRGLVLSLPFLVASVVVGFRSPWPWVMFSAMLLLVAVGGVSMAAVLAALFGRTVVSEAGIANRRRLVEEDVPWADVVGIEIRVDPGRRVVVTRRSGRRIELAGPREDLCTPTAAFEPAYRTLRTLMPAGISAPDPPARGSSRCYAVYGGFFTLVFLVVVALLSVYERPWNAPWWPGRHEASEVPDACRASAAAAQRFGLTRDERAVSPPVGLGGTAVDSACAYRSRGGDTLTVSVEAYHWSGHGASGTRVAHDRAVDHARGPERRRAAPAIGADEVWLEVDSHSLVLRVREANVVVVVTHMSDTTMPGPDAASAVTSAVLNELRVVD